MFKANYFTRMGFCFQVYNNADVVPFFGAFRKRPEKYYPDKDDVCKHSVVIPGTTMYRQTSLPRTTKSSSYMHQKAFVEIDKRSFRIVVTMAP